MKPNWIATGAGFGLLAVLLGAFGAHGLETALPRITPHLLDVYKTGAHYQMVHALGLILVGMRMEQRSNGRRLPTVCVLFAAGIVVFSGSLYLLAISGEKHWGAVTPLGGLCFIIGWAIFAIDELLRGRTGK